MSSPASRFGDICSGHACFPPRSIIQSSTNVISEGKGNARIGDPLMVHCCGDSCHPGQIARGSRTVFINGRWAARVGDPVNCGSVLMTGAGTVFIGG